MVLAHSKWSFSHSWELMLTILLSQFLLNLQFGLFHTFISMVTWYVLFTMKILCGVWAQIKFSFGNLEFMVYSVVFLPCVARISWLDHIPDASSIRALTCASCSKGGGGEQLYRLWVLVVSCPLSPTFLNDLPFLIPQLDPLTMISWASRMLLHS